jgi:hypothetical protein
MKNTLSTVLAAAAVAFAIATPAHAFNPQPDPPGRWTMMGLVSDQTARLSVLSLPTARGATQCTVTLNFLDAEGNKLVEASTLVLTPGKAQFMDLKVGASRTGSRIERTQFRPDVELLHNPPGYLPCSGVATTLELFDTATGRTGLIVSQPLQVGPN